MRVHEQSRIHIGSVSVLQFFLMSCKYEERVQQNKMTWLASMQLEDRKAELSILIQAIHELGRMGEVKITEWIRRGQITWMKTTKEVFAYGKSPPGLSK